MRPMERPPRRPRDLRTSRLWFVPLLFLVVRPLAVAVELLGARASPAQRALISWLGVRGVGPCTTRRTRCSTDDEALAPGDAAAAEVRGALLGGRSNESGSGETRSTCAVVRPRMSIRFGLPPPAPARICRVTVGSRQSAAGSTLSS